MLALERHRYLLELLHKQGSIRTAEAARQFDVTEETIRRDFEKLEAEGSLLRSHGGAVKIKLQQREFLMSERMEQNANAKQSIAQAALAYIKSGQTILLDASTTALQLARLLPDQPLTVLTNALQTAMVLMEKPHIHTVLLGGYLNSGSQSCTGWAAEEMLKFQRIDTAYLSCRAFHPERGASDATEEQARLKRQVIAFANEIQLLADVSKFNAVANFFFASPAVIHRWITNRKPKASLLKPLATHAVQIEIAS